MSLIKVEHLRKEFSNSTPLTDVCAEIEQGEIISIIGPSGTGKSTFLRCLNLLEQPTSGTIIVDGQEVTDPKCDVTLVRRKMGMVFQHFNLFQNLNVIENITAAPISLLKIPKEQAYNEATELLERVGLAGKETRYPDQMSGGQKQRVAIARAIAMRPKILLLDEPTSALDPTTTGEVLSVIRSLADEGMTMLIVTHEMKFARDISSRVFYMDEGVIYEEGTPRQIFDAPQREKTRRFISKLKEMDLTLDSPDVDYDEIMVKVRQFGREAMLDKRRQHDLMLCIEELALQSILEELVLQNTAEGDPRPVPSGFPLRVHAEHSETDDAVVLELSWGGKQFDPICDGNQMSAAIVRHLASDLSYNHEGKNRIRVELR